jgi:hypothetical protein
MRLFFIEHRRDGLASILAYERPRRDCPRMGGQSSCVSQRLPESTLRVRRLRDMTGWKVWPRGARWVSAAAFVVAACGGNVAGTGATDAGQQSSIDPTIVDASGSPDLDVSSVDVGTSRDVAPGMPGDASPVPAGPRCPGSTYVSAPGGGACDPSRIIYAPPGRWCIGPTVGTYCDEFHVIVPQEDAGLLPPGFVCGNLQLGRVTCRWQFAGGRAGGTVDAAAIDAACKVTATFPMTFENEIVVTCLVYA